jgi:hypothetical protein
VLPGKEKFVEHIRLSRGGVGAHREIPQQKEVLRSVDLMGAAKRALASVGREMGEYASGHGLRGGEKEDRDLAVYALWERGVFRNDDIGSVFGHQSHRQACEGANEQKPAVQEEGTRN